MTCVLVVDDDDDLRECMHDVLADRGYEVTSVRDGEHALEHLHLAQGTLPSVILLDLMMPNMNGFEFRARQIAEPRFASIPVIICTADPKAAAEAAKGVGAAHALGDVIWLKKPFPLDTLLDVLVQAVGTTRSA